MLRDPLSTLLGAWGLQLFLFFSFWPSHLGDPTRALNSRTITWPQAPQPRFLRMGPALKLWPSVPGCALFGSILVRHRLTPDPLAWALRPTLPQWIGAQAYTNNITSKPSAIPKPFKAQSHFGNTSQPSLIISFIFPFSPLWLAKLNTRGFHHHEPFLVC